MIRSLSAFGIPQVAGRLAHSRDEAAGIAHELGFPVAAKLAPADVKAIEEILLRVSTMVENFPEIREIDLNPIFAMPPGEDCLVADARIRVLADRY